jgi:hypothetical protein
MNVANAESFQLATRRGAADVPEESISERGGRLMSRV